MTSRLVSTTPDHSICDHVRQQQIDQPQGAPGERRAAVAMGCEPTEDARAAFTRLWSTVQRALVQSGASGREWACLAALMRFQDDDSGLLCMSVEKTARETGLSEGSVRQGLYHLLERRYLLSDGHELPVLAICEKSSRRRTTTYRLCVLRVKSPALRVLSKREAREMRASRQYVPYDDGTGPAGT